MLQTLKNSQKVSLFVIWLGAGYKPWNKPQSKNLDGNLTDVVTDIVNGINAVKQNAPQAAQEAKTATGT